MQDLRCQEVDRGKTLKAETTPCLLIKTVVVVATFLGLAGCTTTAEFTSKKPRLEGVSEKPVKELSECIKRSWGERSSVNELVFQNGIRLLVPTEYGPFAVFDVLPSGTGSSYTYYQTGYDFGIPQSHQLKGIRSCLE